MTKAALQDGKSAGVGRWILVAVQLALLVAVIDRYSLESPALVRVAYLVAIGFVAHALVPERWRLGTFVALSLAAVVVAVGVVAGGWVLALGLVLVAVLHLPTSHVVRVAGAVALGAGLIWARAGGLDAPFPAIVWPVLGSMFMFRAIVFLYDRAHEKTAPTVSESLGYFFMVPNPCFPLFPVVDFKGFRSSRSTRPRLVVAQQGVAWIWRGVTHLLVYRVVYFYGTIAPDAVGSVEDLLRFLLANILLYLRISGQFHLIIGCLKLFGFDLPETNHLYFLASSFNDYWRRINIYWKDFMMKLFYYPMFFRLKRHGKTTAMVIATLGVFVLSWLLHSYQWFWLLGTFPITVLDGLFWGVVGLLVLANSLWEDRKGRKRSLRRPAWTPGRAARNVAKVLATFSTICVLWSLWTAESFAEWTSMWRAASAGEGGAGSSIWPSIVVLGGLALGAALEGADWSKVPRAPMATATVCGALALLAVSFGPVQGAFGERVEGFLEGVRHERLNEQDQARLERGYYEKLLTVGRLETPLWAIEAERPDDEVTLAERHDIFEWREAFLSKLLRPNRDSTFHGAEYRSNRWGMRDDAVDLEKPEGVYRIALLGSSHTMGHGVANDEDFESRLEVRLNESPIVPGAQRVEVLNFAVPDHSVLEQLAILEQRAVDFDPDMVMFVGHGTDFTWAGRHLARVLREGFEIPYPDLVEILDEAGVFDPNVPPETRRERLPGRAAAAWGYGAIVREATRHGAVPVWVYLPRASQFQEPARMGRMHDIAAAAGFRVVSLSGLWDEIDNESIWVTRSNRHPNAEGHAIIADRLYDELERRPEIFDSGAAWPGAGDEP